MKRQITYLYGVRIQSAILAIRDGERGEFTWDAITEGASAKERLRMDSDNDAMKALQLGFA